MDSGSLAKRRNIEIWLYNISDFCRFTLYIYALSQVRHNPHSSTTMETIQLYLCIINLFHVVSANITLKLKVFVEVFH